MAPAVPPLANPPVAARHGAALCIWFSPWGGYPCKAARVKHGREQSLETNQQKGIGTDGGLSLAGPRHYARFRAACVNLMCDHGVRYYKFDGIAGSNSPAGAGEYRSDIEALWRLMGELRDRAPEVFLNPSSGTWASPFWLLRADSIWRGGGDAGLAGANADVLADTHWIGGDPAQSQVYGWAAWNCRKGILSLRNPADQRATIELTLALAFELPVAAVEQVTLHDVWGTRPDLQGMRMGAAQSVCFDLAPFEVITMEAIPT